MINGTARKGDGVKNTTPVAHRVCAPTVYCLCRRSPGAPDEQGDAGQKAGGHAQFRRNQVVVKCFGEGNAEKECQPGRIRKTLHAQKLFPINGRSHWAGRWRRQFRFACDGGNRRRDQRGRDSTPGLRECKNGSRLRLNFRGRLRPPALPLFLEESVPGFGKVKTGRGSGPGAGAGFGAGSAGFADSRSRFNRMTSASSSPRRKESSPSRPLAWTARTISQTARAMGTPKNTRMMMGIIGSIKLPFCGRNGLVGAQSALRRKGLASRNGQLAGARADGRRSGDSS